MLTYSGVMDRLAEMRSRFDDGFSSSDRLFLQEASIAVLGRPVRNTACRDCYRDAYLEIINKLKKQGKMPKEKTFILRAGVLLHFAGESYVNDNITDTIAMDALIDNIGRRDLFQKVPDNLDEVLAARKAVKAEQKEAVDSTNKEDLLKQVEGLKAVNKELAEKMEGAEKTFEQLNQEKEALQAQVKDAEEALAKKDEAIAAKDAEIAALKEAAAKAAAQPAEKAEEKPAEKPAEEAAASADGKAAEEAPKEGKPAAKK